MYRVKKMCRVLNVSYSSYYSSLTRSKSKGELFNQYLLKEIRKKIADSKFKSESDEICFFKHTKPKIYSRLIYYAKLFNIERKRPRGKSKSQINYFNCHINKLQIFFNDNLNFYHYYRRGAIQFDELYFLRDKSDIRLCPDDFHFLTDEDFSTSHDSTVATILAYDLLIIYLKREIDKLENDTKHVNLQVLQKQSKITWTAHKTDLIELIYALHSTDVINNGTVDIKDIARVIERIFKIDLGDYYRAFLGIRMRKKRRTKFLDELKENLERRMDEIDD